VEIVAIAINIDCYDCARCLTQWVKKIMKKFNHIRSNKMMHRIGVTIAAAMLVAGCASVPAPVEQMATSREAVSNASNAGGNEFAPLQLKSAMEKMDAAEKAMVAKDYVRARQLAEEAQVDAQLAGSMARSAKAKKAADELQEGSRILRQEIDRKTN
jgi:PBP1b-binding outer membrane lipoprotein LpoB